MAACRRRIVAGAPLAEFSPLNHEETIMRKFVVAAMAVLIGLGPLGSAASAQNRAPASQAERQVQPKQQIRKQQWKKGGKYSGRGSTVTNHRRHNLQAPPRGHRWVRDGDDFLLVATATGIIASIVRATRN
jgi:hypothetical protein